MIEKTNYHVVEKKAILFLVCGILSLSDLKNKTLKKINYFTL